MWWIKVPFKSASVYSSAIFCVSGEFSSPEIQSPRLKAWVFIHIKTSVLSFSVMEEGFSSITIAKYFPVVPRCNFRRNFIVLKSTNERLIKILLRCCIVVIDYLDELHVKLLKLLHRTMEHQFDLKVLVSNHSIYRSIVALLPETWRVVLFGSLRNRHECFCKNSWPIIWQLTLLDSYCFLPDLVIRLWLNSSLPLSVLK